MSTVVYSGSEIAPVPFGTWTGGREIDAFGTTAGLGPLPFQRWRTFKEAFAPEIVERAVHETPGAVERIVDPFGGSGTTALAAQFLGVRPTTIEVNPYLADLIEAKLAPYDFDELSVAFRTVCAAAGRSAALQSRKEIFPSAPDTFVEPGRNGQFLFSRGVAERIALYRNAIEGLSCSSAQLLLKVLLGSILVSVSNAVISGKGRRYRNAWRERVVPETQVDALFKQRVLDAIYDLRAYQTRACREFVLLRGDARTLVHQIESCDLAVFSPPYPNSFDYTDVYNVELWALGYLSSSRDNTELRKATLRSHVQIKRDMGGIKYRSASLFSTMAKLRKIRESLWNRYIPDMISAYVADMGSVMSALAERLRRRGRIYMVVGDSRYGGVQVPVGSILGQIANQCGLTLLKTERCRSMRTSPQQGGNRELPETLLILRRD